jgi:hypothetical protein
MKPLSIFEKPIRFELVMLTINFIKQNGLDALFNAESNSLSTFVNPLTKYLDEVREDRLNTWKRRSFVRSPIFAVAAKIACAKKIPLYFPEFNKESIENWMENNV